MCTVGSASVQVGSIAGTVIAAKRRVECPYTRIVAAQIQMSFAREQVTSAGSQVIDSFVQASVSGTFY